MCSDGHRRGGPRGIDPLPTTPIPPDTERYNGLKLNVPDARNSARPLRDPCPSRCWRHGRSLQGPRHPTGPRCCDQVFQGAVLRSRCARGAGYRRAESSKSGMVLVTTADQQSDAAIPAVFRSRLPTIDPSIIFYLEESGRTGAASPRWAGADPLDGTNHFACEGNSARGGNRA
jgi:hypothetical protein